MVRLGREVGKRGDERKREKNINGATCQIKVIFCKAILPIEKKKKPNKPLARCF